MSKTIKEIIIMLLVCLVGLLLFAVIFYEYIPNRKIVPEITEYSAPEQVKELLADDVENRNDQVVLTYKVTGSDLNNYKAKKDYVPGRANPFANTQEDVESKAKTKTNTKSKTTDGNSTTGKDTGNTMTENKTLIDDSGTK